MSVAMRVPTPRTLEGAHVRLEPLSLVHLEALCEAGADPELWRWTTTSATTPAEMRSYVDAALLAQAEGTALPFATIDRGSGRVVGSTRYGNIDRANRRLEIGWTWIARPWQRTALNTEAKLLMLRHAFEELGCMRVELKTDVNNAKSRAAMLRMGAKEEGIFRKHMLCYGGRVRDTAWYAVVDDDWPAVKAGLEEKLARRYE
jgi:N-acetyltransferase